MKKVGILLFDYVDALDFIGPTEVFALASNSDKEQMLTLYKEELLPTRPFEIFTVSETGEEIITHSKIKVRPDFHFNNCPELDILIIPGGPFRAVQAVAKNKNILDWIKMQENLEFICSVCTGAFILAETGLLNSKTATTHHLVVKLLQDQYPDIQVVSDQKVVHEGNIITSGGVSSGIHMALYLVKQILGKTAAERTRKAIEFY